MAAKDTARPVAFTAAFAVWMVSFTQFGGAAVTPAIFAMNMVFADQPLWMVTLISTLPSLTTILGCFLFAVVTKKISFKKVAIVSLAIYAIFGMIPAFWNDSLAGILVCRALTGLGIGFIMPLGATWFLRAIRDRNQRGSYISWNLAIGSVGSVIMTILGGVLAGISWNYTFLAYIFVVLSLVIVVIFFKEPPTVEEIIAEEGVTSGAEFESAKRAKLSGAAWFIIIAYFVFQLGACTSMNMGSVLMAVRGLDVALIGTLLSLFTVATAIFGSFGGAMIRKLAKFCTPLFILVSAVGCFLIAFGNSIPMFAAGYFVLGIGAMMNGLVNFEIGLVIKAAAISWAISLLMVVTNLGNFCSSFFLGALQAIGGPSVGVEFPVLVSGFMLIALAIVFLIYTSTNKQAWGADAIAQRASMPGPGGPGGPAPEAEAPAEVAEAAEAAVDAVASE